MEREDRIEQIIFGVIMSACFIALVVISLEQSRKADVLTAQVKAMRQSMEDAGYVEREPKIGAAR